MTLLVHDLHRLSTGGSEPLDGHPRILNRSRRGDEGGPAPFEEPPADFAQESGRNLERRSELLKYTPQPRRTLADDRFAKVTRPLIGHLAAVARRILGDEEMAWDAVQEALVALWLEGEMPSNPRAWLVRTVVHRSLHLARGRSRRRRHEDQARLARVEPSDQDDPARHMEADELSHILWHALQSLTPDQRAVLVLAVVDKKDFESIAGALGIPIGTVRSRLNRSRKALREVLLRMLPEGYHTHW
jgi:RNA polymerase sigma-70 factor, ECF subfamily